VRDQHARGARPAEALRNDIAADIRLRQDDGALSASLDPIGIAKLLIAAEDDLQTQWLIGPDRIDMGARLLDPTGLPTQSVDQTTTRTPTA
jgi:hypothetical protein